MDDLLKHYKSLELEPGASPKQIHDAYVGLMQVWDPELHVSNPILMAKSKEKRAELEAAYQAFRRAFLELDHWGKEKPPPERIGFKENELSTKIQVEKSKTLMTWIVVLVAALIVVSCYLLLTRGRGGLPAPEPIPVP